MKSLQDMQAQLAALEKQIAEKQRAEKALKKLQACKLNHRTAHKYFSLQETYMASLKS